jgi:fructan beta-fructosidase
MLRSILILVILLVFPTVLCAEAEDLLIADFEAQEYGDWRAEGTAFGSGPARGTLPGQMHVDGFRGQGLVNSFLGGDDATGTLTSPPFEIQRDYINMLVGGGMHPGKACMNLVIDGDVVRTVTGPNDRPGGTERLDWASWDVKELKGKEAVLQIVDRQQGGWGHINIDHIVQSDMKAKSAFGPAQRELVLDKKYLLLPVSNSVPPARMIITVDGQRVHDFDINLALDKVDWWSHLDMARFSGKTATVSVAKLPADSQGLELAATSDTIRNILPLYELRPQLRFSQMRGWNNDPNGMVYYDGLYHLFWQSNPFGWKWANMYWGHTVSKDLVHWHQLPYALYPRVMAVSHCFSGSANIDELNTGGWQTGDAKVIVAAFTDTGSGEALAISRDRGDSWEYIDENPIIEHRGRDPKLVWYAYGDEDQPLNDRARRQGGHWVIAVYDEHEEHGRNIAFYTSVDLKQWQLESHLPGYFECPELFELPMDGDASNRRWVTFGADAQYAIGRFDGKTFTPEHDGKRRVHYGSYYASQCFSQVPNGRVIQIGWARVDMPGMPFNQAFSLPTDLTLKTTADGIRLCAQPIGELESLRGEPLAASTGTLAAEQPVRLETEGQLFDILVDVTPQDAERIKLRFGENLIVYDVSAAKLDEMPLPLVDGKLTFRVVVDRPMYEICGGAGDVYKTAARKDGGQEIDSVQLVAEGGSAKVEMLKVYPMRSIWKK